MAAAACSTKELDVETCPLCDKEFTMPKILPCAHVLCRNCLVYWLATDFEARCPVCQTVIVNVTERIHKNPDVIADAFPTDLSIAAVAESSWRLRKSHQECCVCPNVAAVSLCLNCDDMLCRACADGHGKLRATRHHKVEKLSSLTAQSLAARSTGMCILHTDKACASFCTLHNVSMCSVCASTRHHTCPDVVDLEVKAKTANSKFDELLHKLKAGQADLDQAVSDLDKQVQQIKQIEEDSMQEIEKMYECLSGALRVRCDELKESIRRSSSFARTRTDEDRAKVVAQRGMLGAHQYLVERVKESIPCSQLDDMTILLQARVKDLKFTVPKRALGMKGFRISSQELSQWKDSLTQLGHLADISPFMLTLQLCREWCEQGRVNLPQIAPVPQAQKTVTEWAADLNKQDLLSCAEPSPQSGSTAGSTPPDTSFPRCDVSVASAVQSELNPVLLTPPSVLLHGGQREQKTVNHVLSASGPSSIDPHGRQSTASHSLPASVSTGQPLLDSPFGQPVVASHGQQYIDAHGHPSTASFEQPGQPSTASFHQQGPDSSSGHALRMQFTLWQVPLDPFEMPLRIAQGPLKLHQHPRKARVTLPGVRAKKMVRFKYSKEYLLSLRASALSKLYPRCLADFPEISLGPSRGNAKGLAKKSGLGFTLLPSELVASYI